MIAHYLRQGRKTASGFTAGGARENAPPASFGAPHRAPRQTSSRAFPAKQAPALCAFTVFAGANHFFFRPGSVRPTPINTTATTTRQI